MRAQRTALCIQDLSCVGRSSLAAVLPTLAAAGVQPCALPTALLSTHYGGFGTPAHSDESAFLSGALDHYARLGLSFDCVYSGYLPDAAQTELVERAFALSPGALRVVDPATADHGRLYSSVTPELFAAQLRLCAAADIIVPNATEAALLLGEDGVTGADGRCARRHAMLLLERFPRLRCAVVTGATATDTAGENDGGPGAGRFAFPFALAPRGPRRGNVCAMRGQEPLFLPYEAVPQAYPGTGDLFAAALTGALLNNFPEASAVRLAARFVSLAARRTLEAGADARFGVRFEPLLGVLAQWIAQPVQP